MLCKSSIAIADRFCHSPALPFCCIKHKSNICCIIPFDLLIQAKVIWFCEIALRGLNHFTLSHCNTLINAFTTSRLGLLFIPPWPRAVALVSCPLELLLPSDPLGQRILWISIQGWEAAHSGLSEGPRLCFWDQPVTFHSQTKLKHRVIKCCKTKAKLAQMLSLSTGCESFGEVLLSEPVKSFNIFSTWTCARHLTLSRLMFLSLNWKDMDLTMDHLLDKELA